MSRIDIEGALPPLGHIKHQKQGSQQDKERFTRYLQSPATHELTATKAPESGQTSLEQWADYRIASGVLSGTLVRVSLTAQGLVLRLSCPTTVMTQRLLRLQGRWQRELTRLGMPCSLEVTHAVEFIP